MGSVTEQLDADNATLQEEQREKHASAKLKLAYATRRADAPAKPTGVKLMSPAHHQLQEIFDDGSVRNPYKVNRELSGRQRRKMRKTTNRLMKQRGVPGRVEDVLKGRQPAVLTSPAPAADPGEQIGMPVALHEGD